MTLLDEIIEAAAGDSTGAATLLRKLKVVAARAASRPLGEWVEFELNGYPESSKLPPYRGPFNLTVLGHFFGPFHSQLKNVAIPESTLPEELRGPLFEVSFSHPIAVIEDMTSQSQMNVPWSGDVIRFYNWGVMKGSVKRVVREDMVLGQADRPIPRQLILGIVDAVRTRVLDLALELEKVAPDVGQPGSLPSDQGRAAQQVISTYNFYGSAGNVAIGSTGVNQQALLPAQGDEDALMRYLAAVGVAADQRDNLRAAIAADRQEAGGGHPPKPGKRVRAWLADVGTATTSGAASGLILEAIKSFFGA